MATPPPLQHPGLLEFISPLIACDQMLSSHRQWRLHHKFMVASKCVGVCMTSDQIHTKFVPLMFKHITGKVGGAVGGDVGGASNGGIRTEVGRVLIGGASSGGRGLRCEEGGGEGWGEEREGWGEGGEEEVIMNTTAVFSRCCLSNKPPSTHCVSSFETFDVNIKRKTSSCG